MADQTEREALSNFLFTIFDMGTAPNALAEADAILAFLATHRTPTPHVVTTAEELEALPNGTVVKSSAGTIACRHSEFFGVVFGDERPFRWDLLALPATVLTPAPAPVDREALKVRVATVLHDNLCGCDEESDFSGCDYNPDGLTADVLDAIEGVSRG